MSKMENVFKLDQENIANTVKRLQQELALNEQQAIIAEQTIVMGELEKTFRLANYDLKQMPRANEEFYRAKEIAERYQRALQSARKTAKNAWRQTIRDIIELEKISYITVDGAKYLTLQTERQHRHKFLGEIGSNEELNIVDGHVGRSDAAKLLGISVKRIDDLRELEVIPFDIKVVGDGVCNQYPIKFLQENKQKIYNALIEYFGFNKRD